MIFTGKIKAHLDGSKSIDPNALPSHLTCAFGKWYQNKGQQSCGQIALFRDIDAPHAKVHEFGKQAIVACNAGDRDAAARYFQDMMANSNRLLEILGKLEQQCV